MRRPVNNECFRRKVLPLSEHESKTALTFLSPRMSGSKPLKEQSNDSLEQHSSQTHWYVSLLNITALLRLAAETVMALKTIPSNKHQK